MPVTNFKDTLECHELVLKRAETTVLQINVGLTCDLACRHCHLEAGPARREMMSSETMGAVVAAAARFRFPVIDITGGAPELLPGLPGFITALAPLTPRLVLRTNLTALARRESADLPELYRRHGIALVASLPAVNQGQTESQRGGGVWETSISVLKRLNGIGYGTEGSGLELDLVANPAGAFLPSSQQQTEKRFRLELARRYGICFNNLYTFANVPLGRFKNWLEQSGNFDGYLAKLADGFNPCTIEGLMCRSLLSVDWDGYLYDCDFNQAAGLHHGENRIRIHELTALPEAGMPIPVGDHCYACTAGSGFT